MDTIPACLPSLTASHDQNLCMPFPPGSAGVGLGRPGWDGILRPDRERPGGPKVPNLGALDRGPHGPSGCSSKKAHMVSLAEMDMVTGPTMSSMATSNGLPGQVWPPPTTR